MLQLKVIDQTRFKVFGDREYLLEMRFDGTVDLYEYIRADESYTCTSKHYRFIRTYGTLDSLLHILNERSERK